MSLLSQIGKGAAWSAGAQWLAQIMQAIVSVILARLLLPNDYGLMSMAMVFIGFIQVFNNLGLGPALIQRKVIDEKDISTAFWTTLAVGCVISLLAFALSFFIGAFYSEPKVIAIIQFLAIGFVLGAINSVQTSLLIRRMAFREIALAETAGAIASSLAAILAAINGFGVWSLVVGGLSNQTIRIAAMRKYLNWRPHFVFQRSRLRTLFSFGGNILGVNVLNYFNRNLDNLIIGKFLGVTALGFYDLAYQIMLRPIQNVSNVISRPLFPALAKVKEDKVATIEAYLAVVKGISLLTFPMMVGLASVAPQFVHVVLGEKWTPAIPIIQTLALVGAIQSVVVTTGDIFQSQGRPDIMLKWTCINSPLIALSFWVGLRWGILGVAMAYAVMNVLLWSIIHGIANRLIELKNWRFWQALFPAMRASFFMAAGIYLIKQYQDWPHDPTPFNLLWLILAGVLIYGLIMFGEPDVEIKHWRTCLFAYLKNFNAKPGLSPATLQEEVPTKI